MKEKKKKVIFIVLEKFDTINELQNIIANLIFPINKSNLLSK